jgi:GNAT superfamily N-acetyltransferase
VRAFDRDRDLAAVLALVSRSRAGDERGAILHPGGLQWWLRRVGRPGFEVAVACDGAQVTGFALRDASDVIVQADPAHVADRALLLTWAERGARQAGETELTFSVPEADQATQRALLTRGYTPRDTQGFELVHELAAEPASPDLPRDFEILTLTPERTAAYIELHRAAWARPGKPSTYDRMQHDLVTAMPDFRYDLVPIVATGDGTFVAYCMSWWDPRSRTVEIEPLGTHPDFRRRGLARAIVGEVLRRSWALGAKYVLVWGTTGNPEAKALYLSAGMPVRRVFQDYRLALA